MKFAMFPPFILLSQAIGKIGKVVRTSFTGDVFVTYELPTAVGHPLLQMLAQLATDRWMFNPACLKKVFILFSDLILSVTT